MTKLMHRYGVKINRLLEGESWICRGPCESSIKQNVTVAYPSSHIGLNSNREREWVEKASAARCNIAPLYRVASWNGRVARVLIAVVKQELEFRTRDCIPLGKSIFGNNIPWIGETCLIGGIINVKIEAHGGGSVTPSVSERNPRIADLRPENT